MSIEIVVSKVTNALYVNKTYIVEFTHNKSTITKGIMKETPVYD